MRIAHIVCVFPPYKGGISNSAYHFARLLAERGYNNTVFTPAYKNLATNEHLESTEERITVIKLAPLLTYGKGAFLFKLYKKLNNYDLVILHYPFYGTAEIVYLYKLFNSKKNKLILHYHMDVSQQNVVTMLLSLPSLVIKNNLFKRADAITCANLDYINNSQISKLFNKYKKKFYEIPFGVDTEKFKLAIKKDESKINKVLFVGALDKAHYFKGVSILLKAVVSLDISTCGDWKLNIIGDGDMRAQYEEEAKSLGIKNKVVFYGKVSDVDLIKYYQGADVFVLPSINKNEAFGLVLLEAMACGVPVVASNLPGVRKVFETNKEGLLVKPGSSKDLALKLTEILTNDLKKKSMSIKARELALNKYTWDQAGYELDKVIKKL